MSSTPSPIFIESIDDPRLDDYRNIRDRNLRSAQREQGRFIGESVLVVERMLAQPAITRSVLASEKKGDRLATMIADSPSPSTPLLVVSDAIIKQVAGFDLHRGVLACGERNKIDTRSLVSVLPDANARATLLLCDGINNIDNIGLLFRNAAAFGVDAVILSPDCHDPLYRKSLRVSIGHALQIPYHRCDNWRECLEALRNEHGFQTIASSLDEQAIALDAAPQPDRLALIMGSEFNGICEGSRDAADALVRIPMAKNVDSLNVAAASAVLLHHFKRA